jgi:hypothetical protein
MTDSTSDVAALFPAREVVIQGETISISPFKFGQLQKVSSFLAPMAAAVQKARREQLADAAGSDPLAWPLMLPQVIAECGDFVLGLIAFVTGRPLEWVESLEADDGLTLARTIFETNADFFARRLAPMMTGLPAVPGGGDGWADKMTAGPASSAA